MTPTLEQRGLSAANAQRPRPHPGDQANDAVHRFVHRAVRLCRPDVIYWCNGSAYEHSRLTLQAARESALEQSASSELIPTPPPEAQPAQFESEFRDCMIGHTMYVVPFIGDSIDASPGNVTVEITDSLPVVLKIASQARIGDVALATLGSSPSFTRTLHSTARGIIKHDYAYGALATANAPPATQPLNASRRPPQLFGQILVAVDHSKQAGWAVDLAARIAREHKSRLTLLHVVFIPPLQPELGYIEPSDREDCFREARALLEGIKATVPGDLQVQTVLREGDAPTEIVKAAQSLSADLIVIGTHGRGTFGRMILGSVANAVVRKSACPVLTVAHAPGGSEVAPEACEAAHS